MRHEQNRRQNVNKGALRLCGGLHVRAGGACHSNLTKIPLLIVLHILIWGPWICVWGLSPPKPPVATGLDTKSIVQTHTALTTQVDKNRKNRTFCNGV